MSDDLAQEPFVDLDMDPEAFRQLGYQAIDMMAEYYDQVRNLPVFPPVPVDQVAQVFDEPLPRQGQPAEQILKEWPEKVLPHTTHLGSPRYFGFVNGSGSMIGTLAEALAASVNMNPGGWKPAPAATEIERRVIRWVAELIGFDPNCGGLITSGGTMANYTALLTALRNTADYDTTEHGLQTDKRQGTFTVYMSDHEGHVSIKRVLDMLNLGRRAIRLVPSRPDYTIDPDALERMLDEAPDRGDIPFCVVAQVGSINVGAIDPLDRLSQICRSRGLWLHADGACGAVGAMLPELADHYRGLEKVDSITLDPHKWLYIAYEAGCLLVREPERLRRSFSMLAPYLRGEIPTEYSGVDYFEYGPQMSRGFKSLKLWMTLKHYGRDGYRQLLRQNIACAAHLDKLVRQSDDFEALHQPLLYLYSFRYAPAALQPQEAMDEAAREEQAELVDHLNQLVAEDIQLSGDAFIMTTKMDGRTVLRLSICSHRTTIEDIEFVFARLRELGEARLPELV